MSLYDLSLKLESIFPLFDRDHVEPASLAYMGACAVLRKQYPEADIPCPSDSEQDGAGSWVLRDLHHAPIATVDRMGNVTLANAPAPLPVKVATLRTAHGIEVHEQQMPTPVVIPAQVVIMTVWRCPCGASWKKAGSHHGVWKVCRSCGQGGWLRAAK